MFEVMDEARAVLARGRARGEARRRASEIPWVSGGGMASYHVALLDLRARTSAELEQPLRGDRRAAARATRIFTDVRSSYESGRPEVQATVDRRRAADLGVSLRSLATTLRTLVGGVDAVTYQEDGERYDVRVAARAGPARRTRRSSG